ncbi:MAG: calcium-binding protein [Phycisphaerales bacterium]
MKDSNFPPGWNEQRVGKGKKRSMAEARKNAERENRIEMEIIVDAYGPEEQAMGWYYYLEDKLYFPFLTTCIAERAISPLRKGDEVEIVGMAPEEECQHEMFVETRWERRTLAIPLSQLKPIAEADEGTTEAIEDWHYWVGQGYML